MEDRGGYPWRTEGVIHGGQRGLSIEDRRGYSSRTEGVILSKFKGVTWQNVGGLPGDM